MMPKLLLVCVCCLTLTAVGTALAASEDHKVTGTVEKFDERSGRTVIDGQAFIMEPSGPLALTPEVGHKVLRGPERPEGRHQDRAA